MGKRTGVTKSGRVMNPADRERKQMRLKELKRNKKERVKIRQTIVKSRDPRELIDHMDRLDDQEFDLQNELALNVINDKRSKYRGAFIQMITLYRQEKDDKQVKELETMLHEYELRRFKKEQHYKAQLFSRSADPDEIPLPAGAMAPNAALTPFAPPPLPPQFHSTMTAGILKKPTTTAVAKKHKYPPGPPCGLPPALSDDEDAAISAVGEQQRRGVESTRSTRRVHFTDRFSERLDRGDNDYEDDDYAPVEIPDSMLQNDDPPPQNQPVYARNAPPTMTGGAGVGAIIPPGMASLPPRHSSSFPPPPLPTGMPFQSGYPQAHMPSAILPFDDRSKRRKENANEPNFSAVISVAPQVNKPTVDAMSGGGEPVTSASVISAAPQIRNLKKETTRFVPTSLRVNRPAPAQPRRIPPGGPNFYPHKPSTGVTSTKSTQQPRSTDETCDEFLRDIQALL